MPYVPILGPVHPSLADATLFNDVFTAARGGTVLPFDKDSRWTSQEHEVPIIDEIVHRPERTIIPVLSRRGGGTIKLYHYGPDPDVPGLRAATRRSCLLHGAAHGHVVVFGRHAPAEGGRTTRILMKDFHTPSPSPRTSAISELHPDQLADFLLFADRLVDHGFGFLGRRLTEGSVDGPVLLAWDGIQLVGAIGPLTTLPDRQGTQMMLPQYFGVLPDHHGHGHGRALWRAAADWGHRHGAVYQLLQTELGQASDRLFLSEGLQSLGFTTAVPA